ncbi:MAG: CHC2 zinc finger domain-containing protein, partial [Acetobacteraceae bacterium]
MALPASFLEELRFRTPLAGLVGRRVKLERAGKTGKACCPFHNEKTPSYYIYEDGYHCFGCGAHGDAIG